MYDQMRIQDKLPLKQQEILYICVVWWILEEPFAARSDRV